MDQYPDAPQPGKARQPEGRVRVAFQFLCVGGFVAACCAALFAAALGASADVIGLLDIRVGAFCALVSQALGLIAGVAGVPGIIGGVGWYICARWRAGAGR